MMTETRHLRWGAVRLWQALDPLLPGIGVEVLARTESTNTLLLERARHPGGRRQGSGHDGGRQGGRRASDHGPCLLVAEHQTDGRGRQGRAWLAAPGASLTFSLSLAFAPQDWSGLSLAVGLALAEALDPGPSAGPPRVWLKWPNDLWLLDADGGGRKLGGVLIESVSLDEARVAVIGVGLNVLPQSAEGMSCGYACMHELDERITAPALLQRVAAPLVRALLEFERDGLAPVLEAYHRRDLLRGCNVSTTTAECPTGIAEGVEADGALRVRAPDGSHHRLISGEVSVRPQGPTGEAGEADAGTGETGAC